jgi:hypothetical protein
MPYKKHIVKFISCRLGLSAFMAIAILMLNSSIAPAATYSWNVASGDWSTATNWKTGVEPTSSDTAYITNGGTATITQSGEVCKYLYLGSTTNTGTVQMTDGSLTAGENLIIYGKGTFNQSGGTVNCPSGYNPSDLIVGCDYYGNGTYNLSGTGNLISYDECVGSGGIGTFNHTGGTNTVQNLSIGDMGGGGAYALGGLAVLNAAGECLGCGDYYPVGTGFGTGDFMQDGGTNSCTSSLHIGKGGTGYYYLVSVAESEIILVCERVDNSSIER